MARPEDLDDFSRSPNVDSTEEIEGLTIPEHLMGADAFGITAAEQEAGESLEARARRDLPEELVLPTDQPLGVGRLVAPDGDQGPDTEAEEFGTDEGIDDGDFSAEEAAMHITEPE